LDFRERKENKTRARHIRVLFADAVHALQLSQNRTGSLEFHQRRTGSDFRTPESRSVRREPLFHFFDSSTANCAARTCKVLASSPRLLDRITGLGCVLSPKFTEIVNLHDISRNTDQIPLYPPFSKKECFAGDVNPSLTKHVLSEVEGRGRGDLSARCNLPRIPSGYARCAARINEYSTSPGRRRCPSAPRPIGHRTAPPVRR